MSCTEGRDLTLEPLSPTHIEEAATFIARLNRTPTHHCGTDPAEIAHSFARNITEVVPTEAFAVARVNGRMVGLLGADVDMAVGDAELWGPFVTVPAWHRTADALWNKVQHNLAGRAPHQQLFCNVHNSRVVRFATRHGFRPLEGAHILHAHRTMRATLPPAAGVPLGAAQHAAFVALHDQLWPDAYYSGRTILDRLHPHRQVFVMADPGGLLGYVYAEAEPRFGEGSVEFVGVAPAARRRGVGSALVVTALHWLYSFPTIGEIRLTVGESNTVALRLYEHAGFARAHTLYAFERG